MADAAAGASSRAFKAAWLRLVFAVCAALFIPLIDIRSVGIYVGIAAYFVFAVVFQVLLRLDIGGQARTWISGFADMTFLSFMIHRVGATSTALISLYVLFPAIYALVGRARVAFWLGAYGAASYVALLLAEYAGLLPIGPDEPAWAAGGGRPLVGTLMWATIVGTITFVTTLAIARLARTLEQREAELVRTNAHLEELSVRDPLTALFNRRHINERVEIELARVRRGHTAGLLMIDLDGFKAVNDDLGHLAGDEALKRIAAVLVESIREVDAVGRYGGDEFVVVLSDPQPPDTTTAVGQRLARAVREAGEVDDRHRVSASIGAAVAREGDSVDSLLARADARVYEAKQAGGDRVVGP